MPSIARRCQWLKVIQLILNWRHTSTGLHRSVHTASTAWALSIALGQAAGALDFFSLGVLSFVVTGFIEVINQFLFLVLFITDAEFEFALLGPQHDRLAIHATDHVEGSLGFAAQGQFQEVFLNARLDGFAQCRLDLEEAVGRADAVDALMRPLVVVIFNPEFDPFTGRVEAVELRPGQELLPNAFPEPFDLAQSHGMVRTALEVGHPILFEFGLEAAGAAPRRILTAIVGEHLFGRRELACRHPINFDHRLRRRTAKQLRTHQETRVIIQKGDQIGVTTSEPEGEDVRLPHLIGRGPLEETGPGHIAPPGPWRRRHQLGPVQVLAHRFGAGG